MSRLIAALAVLCLLAVSAHAQGPQRSECLAMASAPRAVPVNYRLAAKAEDVAITYAGHSTYYIDTPQGVRIATFAEAFSSIGWAATAAMALAAPLAAAISGVLTAAIMAATWKVSPRRD